MEHHLAIRKGADGFAIIANIGDQHDAISSRFFLWRPPVAATFGDFTKVGGKFFLLSLWLYIFENTFLLKTSRNINKWLYKYVISW